MADPTNGETPHGDDATWIARLRAGDPLALEQIFAAYYDMLVRFAFRWTRSMEAAEDIVQDVFVWVWERRASLTVRSSLKSYLFGATHHRLLDEKAHDAVVARHAAHMVMDAAPVPMSVAPDAEVLANELRARTERRIDALPPRTRDVYRLSRDAELSYGEIASTLGISVNTVYVLMGRALKALKAELDD
jgi:RNA polymerase sigma-70 factor (ECF subfamily)